MMTQLPQPKQFRLKTQHSAGTQCELRIATVSDIHLGHRQNPTTDIVANLDHYFKDDAWFAKLDILFIAGDVFDRLLNLPQDEVSIIDMWIARLLRLCKKHDVVLRVLEGTESHDWFQSRRFETANQTGLIGADLKFVSELTIEHIERFGITVLYVPDDLGPTDKTLARVKDLIAAKGLTKVDYAVMHGAFSFQFPNIPGIPVHDPEEYLKLVKGLIWIGHVHSFCVYDRIIPPGSFDRLKQAEEEPKGFIFAIRRKDGHHDVKFIENERAHRFVRVYCEGEDLQQTLAAITDQIKDLPPGSHVELVAKLGHPVLVNFNLVIADWMKFVWSKKIIDEVKATETETTIVETAYSPVQITPDNLGELMMDRLMNLSCPGEVIRKAAEIMEELINGH